MFPVAIPLLLTKQTDTGLVALRPGGFNMAVGITEPRARARPRPACSCFLTPYTAILNSQSPWSHLRSLPLR